MRLTFGPRLLQPQCWRGWGVLVAILYLLIGAARASTGDAEALKHFINAADLNGTVAQNWTGDDPCATSRPVWKGVNCTDDGNVTSLILDSYTLTGSIPASTLGRLHQLRILSLAKTGLTGRIPADLINCSQLKFLYLNGNRLSGLIPATLSERLRRLVLSNNNLSGSIPPSFTSLTHLLTLELENNRLSGTVPAFDQINLTSFNVSNNLLTGRIPVTVALKRFNMSSFSGNPLLCGAQLPACRSAPPPQQSAQVKEASARNSRWHLSRAAIIGIVVGDVAMVLSLVWLFRFYYKKVYSENRRESKTTDPSDILMPELEIGLVREGQPISVVTANQRERRPQLVFFEFQYAFGLEDLLRASAEYLGKGTAGTVYRAVLEVNVVVAVKRLHKEVISVEKTEFDRQIGIVGNIRHTNIVPLWAYYHGKEEKLLVYEYQPNGTLFSLLHSAQPGPARTAAIDQRRKPSLAWKARLKIVRGIASGLAYLHHASESPKIPHGNIKSCNVLINSSSDACISDYGLTALVKPSVVESEISSYKAPEYDITRTLSLRTDIYSFGVVLLELLTGKRADDNYPNILHNSDLVGSAAAAEHPMTLPQWVNSVVREEWTAEVFDTALIASKASEESLVTLLQIAMACVSESPEQRPRMTQVLRMIKDIKEDDNYNEPMSSDGGSSDANCSSGL